MPGRGVPPAIAPPQGRPVGRPSSWETRVSQSSLFVGLDIGSSAVRPSAPHRGKTKVTAFGSEPVPPQHRFGAISRQRRRGRRDPAFGPQDQTTESRIYYITPSSSEDRCDDDRTSSPSDLLGGRRIVRIRTSTSIADRQQRRQRQGHDGRAPRVAKKERSPTTPASSARPAGSRSSSTSTRRAQNAYGINYGIDPARSSSSSTPARAPNINILAGDQSVFT